ncbi:MAG: D-alanyl-D-alanine carboxypeptidase, partial [Anaerovoracaceae bacterium]
MRNKFFKSFILVIAIAIITVGFGNTQVSYGEDSITGETFNTNSNGVVVLDAKNNTVLYNKEGDTKFYPASCTKILTAIIAIEKGKM